MKTLINGKEPQLAIEAEVLRQIKEANPAIDPAAYEKKEDIPGFLELMQRPCGICIDKSDPKLYIRIRSRMYKTGRLRKTAAIDFRRYKDGRTTVAAIAITKNKAGQQVLQELWEEAIGWDIVFER